MAIDLKKFEQSILKTGFAFEDQVSSALKEKGWSVISNKYYIDDHEETVREIDLIAYKAKQVQHFTVYTALIISCKKNDSNVWALLSRPLDKSDPNRNWHPVHAWTNDRALQFHLEKREFGSDYHSRVGDAQLKALSDPELDIFAFQEMNQVSGSPQNDKAIFSSITSLMKAQAYELRALPSRKNNPCVYHFSLLSVVDAEMIRLTFDGAKPKASELRTEQYLASYIIEKKQEVSRIRFIGAPAFKSAISDYNKLHSFNWKVFSDYCDEFYAGALESSKKRNLFVEDFRKAVHWPIYWQMQEKFGNEIKRSEIDLQWNADKNMVEITIPLEGYHFDFLNQDVKAKDAVREALKKFYRYSGSFEFAIDDIPF